MKVFPGNLQQRRKSHSLRIYQQGTVGFDSMRGIRVRSQDTRTLHKLKAIDNSIGQCSSSSINQQSNKASGSSAKPIAIVGGGPAGCLAAYLLAEQGHDVEIFEKDSEQQVWDLSQKNKSFSMCISQRGADVLQSAGIDMNNSKHAIRSDGLVVHLQPGLRFNHSPEGNQYLISRAAMRYSLLQKALDTFPDKVKVHYGCSLQKIDQDNDTVFMKQNGQIINCKYSLLVGADGSRSQVRQHIATIDKSFKQRMHTEKSQQFKSYAVPTHVVPAHLARSSENANKMFVFHNIRNCILFMSPSTDDNVFRGILLMPVPDWEQATDIPSLERTIKDRFGSSLNDEVIAHMARQFHGQRANYAGNSVYCNRLHHNRIVLLGDAGHGMLATFGQGCSAALESARVLAQCFAASGGDVDTVGPSFTAARKHDSSAIVAMSRTAMLGARPIISLFYWLEFMLLYLQHLLLPTVADPPAMVLVARSTDGYANIRSRQLKSRLMLGGVAVLMAATQAALAGQVPG